MTDEEFTAWLNWEKRMNQIENRLTTAAMIQHVGNMARTVRLR